ncbi:hypothetical protein HD597_012406 [Nonomuraea thailandensis]|uniref:Uncharacterized protein n=1 Tax=Nonomuraea thailandensis TaxID=1188745 RepID=A0A9X2H0Z0_9ACTN|nr:hypothetical protein [Nonomuraea thailandensis]MCP2365386.1 hypothetical protein [Nonomuraea thailandensis]
MAAAFLTAGGAFLSAASAEAGSTRQSHAAAGWSPYKNYATHAACQREGGELLNAGIIQDYDCSWDSPYWLLSVYR